MNSFKLLKTYPFQLQHHKIDQIINLNSIKALERIGKDVTNLVSGPPKGVY
jgi:hypothetical protein